MDTIGQLGLTIRRPTLDDVETATRLFERVDLHDTGAVDTDADETRDDWRTADLANDHWLVTDAAGGAVAYGEVQLRRRVHLEGWVAVDPAWRRRGIGTVLADLVEARATELLPRTVEGARVTLEGWVDTASQAGVGFVADRGMSPVRRFWRMRIDLADEPPERSALPEGIDIRPFEVGQDERATWEASEDAFADHWGHVRAPFEEWIRRTQGDLFDPGLWFLATEGDTIVGTALCSPWLGGGWVGSLGVRRRWRGRGIGEALLRRAFAEFHRRGRRTVALGVDAESLTGATRLYERAGMRVDRVYELSIRVLRAGESLETA